MLRVKFKGSLLKNSLLLEGDKSFVLVRPSTVWMRPIEVTEDHLVIQNLDLNVNLIQNTLTEIP